MTEIPQEASWGPESARDAAPANGKYDFAEQVSGAKTLRRVTVPRAVLLHRIVDELIADRVVFHEFQGLDAELRQPRFLDCKFEGGEFVASRFDGAYLRQTTFEGTAFRSTVFSQCVLDRCSFPLSGDAKALRFDRCVFIGVTPAQQKSYLDQGIASADCVFVEETGSAAAPAPSAVRPTVAVPRTTTPSAAPTAPSAPAPSESSASPAGARFAQLER